MLDLYGAANVPDNNHVIHSSQYRKWLSISRNSIKGSNLTQKLDHLKMYYFAKYTKYFLSVFKNLVMELVVPSLMFVVMIIIIIFSSTPILAQQQGSTCNACNCEFNINSLTQLIESITAESVGKL